jgi:hypothetical protein
MAIMAAIAHRQSRGGAGGTTKVDVEAVQPVVLESWLSANDPSIPKRLAMALSTALPRIGSRWLSDGRSGSGNICIDGSKFSARNLCVRVLPMLGDDGKSEEDAMAGFIVHITKVKQ